MRYVLALFVSVALLSFAGFTHAKTQLAKDPAKPKTSVGVFQKLDGKKVVYLGGKKGKGKEHTILTDDKTKVTLEGKDATLADLKKGVHLSITEENAVATIIAATAEEPADTAKTDKPDKK